MPLVFFFLFSSEFYGRMNEATTIWTLAGRNCASRQSMKRRKTPTGGYLSVDASFAVIIIIIIMNTNGIIMRTVEGIRVEII